MRIGIVYKAVNVINGKCYVGQTLQSFERRKYEHQRAAICTKSARYKTRFYCAIRKYGWENFAWEVVAKDVPADRLNGEEVAAIKASGSFGPGGYNSHSGGGSGGLMSEEVKRKISASKQGKVRSEEHKKNLSIAGKKREHSAEWWAKWTAQQGLKGAASPSFGKRPSPETLKKMSDIKKGKVISDETREKVRGAVLLAHAERERKGIPHPLLGTRKSEGALRKLSASLKGRKFTDEHKAKISAARLRYSAARCADISSVTAIS